jgi:hypothetical protein
LAQVRADGQEAQAGDSADLLSQGGAARWEPEPLKEKAPALTALVTFDPQGSWISSGEADIFWITSNRPHFGQSYS